MSCLRGFFVSAVASLLLAVPASGFARDGSGGVGAVAGDTITVRAGGQSDQVTVKDQPAPGEQVYEEGEM